MRHARTTTCAVALLFCVPGASRSQGFQLNEVGTCAVARGQAVTGATCGDPSVIYWSPGAATSLPGWSAYAGVSAVDLSGSFTADTSRLVDDADVPVAFPPHLFVNYTNQDQRWSAGVGVYVPYGLTSQWKQDFPGRFAAQKASLQSIYIQPNFAYRFAEGWSIGGGPVFGHSSVELRQGVDLAEQQAAPSGPTFGQLGFASGTEFARVKLKGSATAWGFNVGIHGQLTPNWEVGVRYLSRLTFDYEDADANFEQIPTELILANGNPLGAPGGTPLDILLGGQFAAGAPLSARNVSTRIKHPAQFQAGLGYSGFTQTVLSADFAWTQFSSFDRLPVNFQGENAPPDRELIEDYDDSWSVRAGVEHAFAIGIKGRVGFNYIHTPAPDVTVTPLLPDMDRRNLAIGVGIPLTSRYTIDAGYLRVDTEGRRGRIHERTSESQTAADLNSGFYTLDANVWSVSIRANF